MSCSLTGASMSVRSGCFKTLPVRPSWSACSHDATVETRSVASRIVCAADELPRLRARGGEAEAVDDVVEARLEQAQKLLARHAGALRRLLVVVAELLLEQPVVAAGLLLLAQLQEI